MTPLGLREFLSGQRWFAGQSEAFEVQGVEVVGVVRDHPLTELWLVRVDSVSTSTTYQLVVEYRSRSVARLEHVRVGTTESGLVLYDALHDREITRDWLSIIDGEGTDEIRGHRISNRPLPRRGPSLVMTAEQSNTSLVFGDSVVLKFYRRPQPGVHPDVEIHQALAEAGCSHVAESVGYIDAADRTIAYAQEFLTGGVEGWELAKNSVRDLLREGDLHADEVGGDFAAEAQRLGEVTGEVHQALSEVLPTAVWGHAERRALARRFTDNLRAALDLAPLLAPYAAGLEAIYAAVAAEGSSIEVQRVHGDLHLGQTMRVPQGWKLLDFEGEPSRPVEERRALDSPHRDVAGMLRSFDYAAQQFSAAEPLTTQADYRAREWATRNQAAFCEGYAKATGRDPRHSATLLRAYEADKAVYEVVYETTMRPAWVAIPLAAVERLAG